MGKGGSKAALARAYNRGLRLEKASDAEGAAAAFREALALDPDDHGGAAVRLAALGRGPVPDGAPAAYVATLFDQNAANFDDMLVEHLGYAVPMLVRERLEALGLGPFKRLLDLGCGTGLTGASMIGLAAEAVGVDLSEAMLDKAHERGCYDGLYVGDAVTFLEETDEPAFDLIAATDVLPYLGALERFATGARRCLSAGGLLVVSTETLPEAAMAGRNYAVGPKHRFAHAEGYLHEVLAGAGLALVEDLAITVRHDEGQPVPGRLVTARL